MGKMQAINPATEELMAEYDTHLPDEVDQIVSDVDNAWVDWRKTSFSDRSAYLNKAADLLEENAPEYAELMLQEMGKPLAQGEAEAKKCAWVCRYYAENAEDFLKDEIIDTDAKKTKVSYRPIGTILTIMPWNFPFWQVFRQIAPNLMAGNTMVLKHASNVPGCALAIEKLMSDSGLPKNVFRTLMVPGSETERVIINPRVKGVSITGSTPAGKKVAAAAGSVLKKCVLELGGSDPYVVLEDADIDSAAQKCAFSRLINGGQSCIAAKRFIVVDSIYDEFVEKFIEQLKTYKVGYPNEESTQVGPLARVDLRDELHNQVTRSVEAGAKISLGGDKPEGKGAFYPVTVLENIQKGNPAYGEEFFGPVALVIRVKDEAEAIMVANDTEFGLGGAVFSRDESRAENIATNEIDSGAVFVNSFVASDPRVPFGGTKQSGYGRELGQHGIYEFVNVKSVQIA